MDLGGSGTPFGRGLGRVLGGVWRLWGPLLTSFFHACIWDGLQKRSWRGQAWILLRFCGVWEGFREGFGQVLGAILKDSGWFWTFLGYSALLGHDQVWNPFWTLTPAGATACFTLLYLGLPNLHLALSSFTLLALIVLMRFPFHCYSGFASLLGAFFALVTHFFDFLTHLKSSCNFLTFLNDFSSSFGGFGVVWGWILGGFFDDF